MKRLPKGAPDQINTYNMNDMSLSVKDISSISSVRSG